MDLQPKVKRTIYGSKQSSRCLNEALSEHLKKLGLKQSSHDPCIYVSNSGGDIIIAVYVNDIIIAGKTEEVIKKNVWNSRYI